MGEHPETQGAGLTRTTDERMTNDGSDRNHIDRTQSVVRLSKRMIAVAAGTAALMTLGVGVSHATLGAHRSGASTWTNAARTQISVQDTADDNQFVAADWRSNRGGGARVTNQNGFRQTVTRTVVIAPEVLAEIRACRSNSLTPMSCGAWNNGR